MFDYLDKEIIRTLIESEGPLTSSSISFKLNKSSRTIRDRSKKINKTAEENGFVIEIMPRVGMTLIIVDKSKFDNFFHQYLDFSITNQNELEDDVFKLISILTSTKEYITNFEISERLFISESKVTVLLTRIKKILKQYNLSIDQRPHYGNRISGNEVDIRRFISSYYVQTERFKEMSDLGVTDIIQNKEVSKIEYEVVKKIVTNTFEIFDYKINSIQLKNIIVHVLIAVSRSYSNLSTLQDNDLYIVDTKGTEYEVASTIIKKIEEELSITVSNTEVSFISMHIVGKKTLNRVDYEAVSPEINELVLETIRMIKSRKGIDLTDDFDLIILLGLHLSPLIKRINFGVELKNPMYEEVKLNCMAGFDLAIIMQELIHDKYGVLISEHEVSYIAIHFDVSLHRKHNSIVKKDILVVCSTGRASAELLRMKFNMNFSKQIKRMDICDVSEVSELLKSNNYDFVFTTIPIEDEISKYGVPIFEFSFFLNDNEIQDIQRVLTIDSNTRSELSQLFNKNQFFISNSKISKKEAINFLCDEAIKFHNLDKSFKQLVNDREKISGTDVLPNVALIHPTNLVTEESFVSILILKRPIFWGHNNVQIVFLVSVGKEDGTKYRAFLDGVIKLASSASSLSKIVNESQYEVLIEELEKMNK